MRLEGRALETNSKGSKKGQRGLPPNIYHFNIDHKGGQTYNYDIGGEPVEVPDYDAKAILAHPRIRFSRSPKRLRCGRDKGRAGAQEKGY